MQHLLATCRSTATCHTNGQRNRSHTRNTGAQGNLNCSPLEIIISICLSDQSECYAYSCWTLKYLSYNISHRCVINNCGKTLLPLHCKIFPRAFLALFLPLILYIFFFFAPAHLIFSAFPFLWRSQWEFHHRRKSRMWVIKLSLFRCKPLHTPTNPPSITSTHTHTFPLKARK